MKAYFLTSSFTNGLTNDFEREFNKYSKVNKKFVYIASSFENYSKTEKSCNYIIDLFSRIDIIFKEVKFIDYRVSIEDAKEIILNSDVVWITGGDTLMQMTYFNEYNLREVLNKYEGIVIGMSAEAINMADNVVLAKDEEDNISELSIYKGLGLVSVNIEPHLDFSRKIHIEDIKKASLIAPIYGLYDDSFILVRNEKVEVYGEYILFDEQNLINS